MEIHIGQLIKTELERQGKSREWFSDKIGKCKSSTYDLFNRRSIDTDELLRISQILGVDFFRLISETLSPDISDTQSENIGLNY